MAQIRIFQTGFATITQTPDGSVRLHSIGLGVDPNITDGYSLSIINSVGAPTTLGNGVIVYSNSGVFKIKQADGSILGGFSAGGDLTGSATTQTVAKLNGTTLDVSTLTDGYVLTYDTASSSLKLKTSAGGGFTAGGDLSGNYSTQTVISISGSSPLAITPSTLQWLNSTATPTLKQADKTTASGTGETLTIQAQNETGTTSTGGALNLTSGIGTLLDGYVNFQSGGVTVAHIVPNKFVSNKGSRKNVTTVTNTYQVLVSDENVIVTTNASGFTITLPASPVQGDWYAIKDGVGNALTNNITVAGNGNNIDGSSNFIMNENHAAISIVYNSIEWSII